MYVENIINDELNKLIEIRTEDNYTIEAVYYRGDTLCVSSQVGCPVRCKFCASGLKGLYRNLSTEEIFKQYELAKSLGFNIKNIAFAGIGEPLLNWKSVKEAFFRFKEIGLKVSFYTTGFPLNNFVDLLNLNHNGLTLSLHSIYEDKRKQLIPVGNDIKSLIETFKGHLDKLSNRKRKLYSLGYLLIGDINSSDEEIEKLGKLAKYLKVGVSLLKYNEIEGIPFRTTTDLEYEKAFLMLKSMGVRTTLSNRYRTRKIGGCGTLMVDRLTSSSKA